MWPKKTIRVKVLQLDQNNFINNDTCGYKGATWMNILAWKIIYFRFLGSHNPKGHVRYFHHLASVVVRKSSSLKPLGQLEPNLVWLFIGWSPTKFMFLLFIRGTQKKQETQRCQKSVSIYIGINYLLFIWFWRWFFNTLKKTFRNMHTVIM